jgi:hypothetical protein
MKKTFKVIALFLALLLVVPVNLSLAESLDESDYYVELEEVSIKDMVVTVKFSDEIDLNSVEIFIDDVKQNNSLVYKIDKLPVMLTIRWFNEPLRHTWSMLIDRDNYVVSKNDLISMYVLDGDLYINASMLYENIDKVSLTINDNKIDNRVFYIYREMENIPIPSTIKWEYRGVERVFYVDKDNVILYGEENINPSLIETIKNRNNHVLNVDLFSDMSNEHWAYYHVQNLALKSIVKGFSDGTFRPDQNMTVREFNTMLNRFINNLDESMIKAKVSTLTLDNIKGQWGYEENKNILERLTKNELRLFNPNKLDRPIKRQDVAFLLDKTIYVEKLDTVKKNNYKDLKDISKLEYKDSVLKLYNYSLIEGYSDQYFRGYNDITRAEVSAMLNRILR